MGKQAQLEENKETCIAPFLFTSHTFYLPTTTYLIHSHSNLHLSLIHHHTPIPLSSSPRTITFSYAHYAFLDESCSATHSIIIYP
jgi:hypothetical protein